MKIGKTLMELAQEITRQQNARQDLVVSTKHVQMDAGGALVIPGREPMGVKPLAHKQLAEHVGIPQRYYDRMLAEAPGLLANNVNEWFAKYPAERMIRTLDSNARAFLSDKYRPLDNEELAEAVLPALRDCGAQIISADITETKLYIKAVDARIQRDIPTKNRMGDGSHVIFDTVSPAVVISNSEVGLGRLLVQTSIWTKACTNLAIFGERSIKKSHVGARHEITEGLVHLLSDETRKLTDQALWAQVKDVVGNAFIEAKFEEITDQLKGATEDKIEGDVVKVVELTAKKYGANEGEKNSILRHLIEGGDLSRYGLSAAVTRASADFESYDRATEFERVGGQLIELPKTEWREIAQAA